MYSKQIIIKISIIKLFKMQNSENGRNDAPEMGAAVTRLHKFVRVCELSRACH